MKQVVARAGKVEIVDVPKPVCSDNGLLVRTECSVISTGTETWTIGSTEPLGASDVVKSSSLAGKALRLSRDVLRQEGLMGLRDYFDAVRHPEVPLGYSSSGVVVEVGKDVTDILVGERVACAGEGKASHSEYTAVPRKLAAKVPEGLATKEAAFSTIGAIALHAVRTAHLQIGETVGVMGVGLVGNLVAQISRASGCRVLCLDTRDDRLQLARELGLDTALRADDPAAPQLVSSFTDGVGLDHVFICAASTSSEPINTAAKLARNRGQVVVVGRVGMDVDRKEFYQKELKMLMTRSLGPGRYDLKYEEEGNDYPLEYVRWTLNRNLQSFMELVRCKLVNVEKLVGAEFPLGSAGDAYGFLQSQSKVAVLLTYEAGNEPLATSSPKPTSFKGKPGKVGVAVVGPGAFAKEVVIPLLRSSPDFSLKWVVSSNPLHARQLESRYRFAGSTCNYDEVLSDPDLGLVVITAPNNLHSNMVSSAMKAGKLALVEKPLCINRQEFDEVKKVQAETGMPIVVGFNRRYAPLVLEMRKRMQKMAGPFVIQYRVNAGFVPASKWSQDPSVGGGRIIHECCHFLDLFNFLLGGTNPRITVESASVNGSNSVARDNVSVALRYPDGSVASLLYVAMGSKLMDRERLEVYGQGTSMVLDDFKALTIYGSEKRTLALARADKGHRKEFEQIARLARGEPASLITTEEVFAATELTFRVDEAVRGIQARLVGNNSALRAD